MDYRATARIYTQLEQTGQTQLKEALLQAAVRYARIRTDWYFMSDEERRDIDRIRTTAHDAFIDSRNILSRNMHNAGEDNSWRAELPDDRKALGDFACQLHCLLGILSR